MGQLQSGSDHFQTGGPERLRRMPRLFWPSFGLVAMVFSLLSGCSTSGDLKPPSFAPDEIAKEVLAQYDTNHDGYLDAKELERCPALKGSLEAIDKSGDKRLSADEIAEHIRMYVEGEVALVQVGCHVVLDGRPLEGATVTYVPEKFMGSSIKSATGVSDSRGIVPLVAEGEKLPGVQPGFYRVQVSKKSASGQEMIAARYNQNTILGIEISPHQRRGELRKASRNDVSGTFRLTSGKS
jgi:hypothetical protein